MSYHALEIYINNKSIYLEVNSVWGLGEGCNPWDPSSKNLRKRGGGRGK
jgi:hypothetical protein